VSRRSGGAPRRPPVKRVSSAVIRSRVRPRSRPVAGLRPEGIRYLRADGTPNWEQAREMSEGDAKRLASHPAIVVADSANILETAEIIAKHKVRGLPVVRAGSEKLVGIVTALDLVNYLGGGEYYNIVEERHKRNIYSALRDEKITSIANPTPAKVYVYDKLTDIVNLMISTGIGLITVVWDDDSVYGVITEHDIVKLLAGRSLGIKVEDIATRSLVTVDVNATIRDAAKTMVLHGFRRLPAMDEQSGEVKGIITAKDIVSYFGRHEAFKHITSTNIEEVLETPVYELMMPGVYTVNHDADVGDVASEMIEQNVNSLLVVDEKGEIIGIVTERDVLEALIQ